MEGKFIDLFDLVLFLSPYLDPIFYCVSLPKINKRADSSYQESVIDLLVNINICKYKYEMHCICTAHLRCSEIEHLAI